MPRTLIAVVNDLHCGSTIGLCPPRIDLDDGGAYEASKAQQWLWQCWNDYWAVVGSMVNDGDQLYVIFNGDLVDGDHHETSQILSRNPEAQAAALRESLAIPLALNPDKLFVVRGTEAHTGKSASAEEGVAGRWRRDGLPVEGDPDTGAASWWHFRGEIEGVYFDVTHHGRTGQREHTRGSAIVLYAHDILMSHIKSKDRPPDLCLRAHHHRFNDSGDLCPTRVITNGAFQLKSGWGHSKFADTLADIGGLIVTVEDGEYEAKKVHFKSQRGTIWTPRAA